MNRLEQRAAAAVAVLRRSANGNPGVSVFRNAKNSMRLEDMAHALS